MMSVLKGMVAQSRNYHGLIIKLSLNLIRVGPHPFRHFDMDTVTPTVRCLHEIHNSSSRVPSSMYDNIDSLPMLKYNNCHHVQISAVCLIGDEKHDTSARE